jgi:starch phosphorylase
VSKALCSFDVVPQLPAELAPLKEISFNLWWSWQQEAIALFRRLGRHHWEASGHNPVKMLGCLGREELMRAAWDRSFLAHQQRVHNALKEYLADSTWFSTTYPELKEHTIAYFSMEFGITECLPIYSGGLGILAGDHLKSASELGLPLVGVGILYQNGYCEQYLNCDGWQQEREPVMDFHNLPIELVLKEGGEALTVSLQFPGRQVLCQVWRAQVGRVPLFLLDSNVDGNSAEDRKTTQQLYGGDQEGRIKQEVVLGIGGMKALREMGIKPNVCHMNEGHAAFLALERIRHRKVTSGVSVEAARQVVAGGTLFTTHTPVPAGIDEFPPWLVENYVRPYYEEAGYNRHEFLSLGRRHRRDDSEPFNMALLALRTSSFANGVSKLHGEVSREMFSDIWPNIPRHEVPIGHVTNGIHTRSWISYEMEQLLLRYLGPDWLKNAADQSVWRNVRTIPDEELWRTHERRRERLITFTRSRLVAQLKAKGAPSQEIKAAEGVMDPEALTIGFARRFATYKRATLLFRDPERLKRIVTNRQRPVQFIFAGKAHPRDGAGKELIKQIVHLIREHELQRHVVFIENYEMNVARYLVGGVDVWLNTPRRPYEASGTSGMKVLPNGGLNLSILDGWWCEGYTPDVGWAIGHGEEYDEPELQDEVEANAIYEILEKELVPLFYDRDGGNLPTGWIEKVKNSMQILCPMFNTNRMVHEYAEKFYVTSLLNWRKLSADGLKGARELSEWQQHVRSHWSGIRVTDVAVEEGTVAVGASLYVEAEVVLGNLSPTDVAVEVYTGPLGPESVIQDGRAIPMRRQGESGNGGHRYACNVPCHKSGRHGLSIRVLPHHENLPNPLNFKHVYWVTQNVTNARIVPSSASEQGKKLRASALDGAASSSPAP